MGLLYLDRRSLKSLLSKTRVTIDGNHVLTECAYCGKGISGAGDMHEAFFTKGDALQGIDHPCNCVLVHPGGGASRCHAGAATLEGQIICAKYLIKWEGARRISQYIDQMRAQAKGTSITEAIYILEKAMEAI